MFSVVRRVIRRSSLNKNSTELVLGDITTVLSSRDNDRFLIEGIITRKCLGSLNKENVFTLKHKQSGEGR